MRKQMKGLNKRHMKSSKTRNLKNEKMSSINHLNASDLVKLFDGKSVEFDELDILVFYYNNHCGFCNLLNYNLMQLVHKYFSNVQTFKLLKYVLIFFGFEIQNFFINFSFSQNRCSIKRSLCRFTRPAHSNIDVHTSKVEILRFIRSKRRSRLDFVRLRERFGS
jgi:hypothetical protein